MSKVYSTCMKYNDWKIKREHHSLKEFEKDLQKISEINEIQRIIPWRISRQQKWSNHKKITFSYFTDSWLKLIMKKWWTAQEVFIVCSEENKNLVKEKLILNYFNIS